MGSVVKIPAMPKPPDPTQLVQLRLKTSTIKKLDMVADAWGVKRATAHRSIVEGFIEDVEFEANNEGGTK